MHLDKWGKAAAFLFIVGGLFSSNLGADAPGAFEAQVTSGIAYYDGPDAHPTRHKLDVYAPKGHKDFPVVFFVHGGAWIHGDKNQFGMYASLGRTLTRHGIGMVSTNYRLSPEVSHPEHIRDVARAFAWTKRNIAKYGGRSDDIFVSGHSAGGHLVALLATDDSYLKGQGLCLKDIKGAMPISGVYDIPDYPILYKVFGKELEKRRQASPTCHACADAPPFLIMVADQDLDTCSPAVAHKFCQALLAKGGTAQVLEVKRRNHISIVLNAPIDTDPVMQGMLSFIMAQVTLDRLGREGALAIDGLGSFLAGYADHASKNGR